MRHRWCRRWRSITGSAGTGHPVGSPAGPRADEHTRGVIGADAFRADVLASVGLDDGSSSNGYLRRAEALMADAVGAEHTFFSTCGSSCR